MLRFFGASDDLAECRGHVEGETYPSNNYGTVAMVGTKEAGCYVRVAYSTLEQNGSWDVTIGRIDEDVPIPWPVKVVHGDRGGEEGESGYTAVAFIDCPDDTPVVWKSSPDEEWSVPR